jgi:hypothetical protein
VQRRHILHTINLVGHKSVLMGSQEEIEFAIPCLSKILEKEHGDHFGCNIYLDLILILFLTSFFNASDKLLV